MLLYTYTPRRWIENGVGTKFGKPKLQMPVAKLLFTGNHERHRPSGPSLRVSGHHLRPDVAARPARSDGLAVRWASVDDVISIAEFCGRRPSRSAEVDSFFHGLAKGRLTTPYQRMLIATDATGVRGLMRFGLPLERIPKFHPAVEATRSIMVASVLNPNTGRPYGQNEDARAGWLAIHDTLGAHGERVASTGERQVHTVDLPTGTMEIEIKPWSPTNALGTTPNGPASILTCYDSAFSSRHALHRVSHRYSLETHFGCGWETALQESGVTFVTAAGHFVPKGLHSPAHPLRNVLFHGVLQLDPPVLHPSSTAHLLPAWKVFEALVPDGDPLVVTSLHKAYAPAMDKLSTEAIDNASRGVEVLL